MIMSRVVGDRPLGLGFTSADDRSSNDRWSRVPGDDRRSGQRVNGSDRRFRPRNEF